MLISRPRSIRSRSTRIALAALLLGAPTVLSAQLGHRPSDSPYEDVKFGQTISLSGGWFAFKSDPAKVAPKSAAFGQLRYDIGVGGPASLYARYSLSTSQRNQYAPTAVAAKRLVATPGVAMHMLDAGLDVALTGKKTWHQLIPSVIGGAGVVSDFAHADSGSYQFGVKFAITYGLGLRYLPKNGLRVRLDVTNYTWQYDYPDSYFVAATDNTALLADSKKRSAWTANYGLALGVSYPLFR
jgi:hypothetical protein